MSQPPPYIPVTSFITYQAQQAWFPGQNLDVEFHDLKTTTDAIRSNLGVLQNDDLTMGHHLVGWDQLATSFQDALRAQGFTGAPSASANPYTIAPSGGDDTTAFQAVLNLMPSGSVLYVLGQLQLLNGVKLTSKSNITIDGRNLGGFKANGVSTITNVTYGGTMLSIVSCTNVRVTGLVVDGSTFLNNLILLNGCMDCTVDGNWVTGGGLQCSIGTIGGTRNHFLRNSVKNMVLPGTGGGGIRIGNVNVPLEIEFDTDVIGNTSISTSGDGFIFSGHGFRIEGNLGDTNGLGGGGCGFIFAGVTVTETAKRSVFNNNIARNGTFHGYQIDIFPGENNANGVVLNGNIAEGYTHTGFFINRIDNVVVSNNVALNNTDAGFLITQATTVVMTGNQAYDTRAGVSRTQVDGYRVISQTSSDGVADVVLADNLAKNNTNMGINILLAGAGTIDDVRIADNMLLDNSQYGVNVTAGATNISVVYNTHFRNTSGGVQFLGMGEVADNFPAASAVTKTGDYSMVAFDTAIIFNASGTATLTLYPAASLKGHKLRVKTIAAHTVVSASSNVAPIDSATPGTAILAGTAGKWADLVSDGTNWVIIGAN